MNAINSELPDVHKLLNALPVFIKKIDDFLKVIPTGMISDTRHRKMQVTAKVEEKHCISCGKSHVELTPTCIFLENYRIFWLKGILLIKLDEWKERYRSSSVGENREEMRHEISVINSIMSNMPQRPHLNKAFLVPLNPSQMGHEK
jgi:hypothetical protein